MAVNRFANSISLSILVVAILLAGCSSQFVPQGEEGTDLPSASPNSTFHSPVNGAVQSHTGGAVTIDVEWEGERDGLLVFNAAMNTHSVDLDQYDLGELAVLRDDGGKEYRPSFWDSAPGGHHRRGTLIFPLPDSLRQGQAQYLELIIRDVAGVKERVLKWELGQ